MSENTNTKKVEDLYIFEGFSKEVVAYFLLMSQVQFRKKGEIIMTQGDKSTGCAYYINSGKVRILIDGKVVATLEKGSFFGAMALITDEPRSATVEVVEDAELQVFLKDEFLTLLTQSPNSDVLKAEIRKRIVEDSQIGK
ncbi:cyclic nucleotide-binding domain-containing protein [Candidatus Gracilibacteria bacterium]|nr:cyclic nucleotide-binding domain-containing protein [Candidatus Gracilibacteria bacterium]